MPLAFTTGITRSLESLVEIVTVSRVPKMARIAARFVIAGMQDLVARLERAIE